jgi:hypothetical protein
VRSRLGGARRRDDIYQGGTPWLGGTLIMWLLIHVGPANSLSLSSSLSPPPFLLFSFSLLFPLFLLLFLLFSFFPLFSSFFLLFSLLSFLSFFLLLLSLSLTLSFLQGRTSTILGTDGSCCRVLADLSHTWTFVSYNTKSQVCNVSPCFRECPIT